MQAQTAFLALSKVVRAALPVVARGVLVLFMVAMIAAYAWSAAKSAPPPAEPEVLPERIYS